MTEKISISRFYKTALLLVLILSAFSCTRSGGPKYYFNPDMDFGSIKTAAVMPLENMTREQLAAERVRDVFTNLLLSRTNIYVMPPGEVARGVLITGITNPANPSPEEIIKLGAVIKVDVVITGAVREYGEVKSGAAAANVISVNLQMIEAATGKIIWTASTTKGGISIWDRLFGGGGKPMNDVTEAAANDLIKKLRLLM